MSRADCNQKSILYNQDLLIHVFAKTQTCSWPFGAADPVIRNQRVILDADLARLYGVTTKAFNQAVKRNVERFPEDFAFQLTSAELGRLRSQTVTSSRKAIGNQEDTDNWSQIVTSSRGGRRYSPWAFTEHGAIMAANIAA